MDSIIIVTVDVAIYIDNIYCYLGHPYHQWDFGGVNWDYNDT